MGLNGGVYTCIQIYACYVFFIAAHTIGVQCFVIITSLIFLVKLMLCQEFRESCAIKVQQDNKSILVM